MREASCSVLDGPATAFGDTFRHLFCKRLRRLSIRPSADRPRRYAALIGVLHFAAGPEEPAYGRGRPGLGRVETD
jgi:hypothetical protein